MRRRISTGGKPIKARRRKTVTLKRRNGPQAARRRTSSAANLHKQVALLTRERDQALEQQTATSEVLQVIGSSSGDLRPVFASMLENAVRICDATFGNIYRWDGRAFSLLATHNTPPAFVESIARVHPIFCPIQELRSVASWRRKWPFTLLMQ